MGLTKVHPDSTGEGRGELFNGWNQPWVQWDEGATAQVVPCGFDRAKQGCVCWAEPGWQKAAVLKGNWFELCFLEGEVEHSVLSSVLCLCRPLGPLSSSTCSNSSGQPKSQPQGDFRK